MIFIENCKYFRICFGPFRELWKISITKKTNVTIFVVVDMLLLRPASRRSSVCTCLDLVASQTQTTLTQCETDTELLLTTRMIRICRLPQTMSRLLTNNCFCLHLFSLLTRCAFKKIFNMIFFYPLYKLRYSIRSFYIVSVFTIAQKNLFRF